MRTILVPTSGSDTDDAVFATALAAARPFSAHLEFFHVRIGVGEAVAHTPHVDFAIGSALRHALDELKLEAETRSAAAMRHFNDLCRRWHLAVVNDPCSLQHVSASFREEAGDSLSRIMLRARHNELVVMGRRTRSDGLPPDTIERLLLECGRPIVVAPARPPCSLTGTIMVCWKETPEAARAVTAAMPLLIRAGRVVVVGVEDEDIDGTESVGDIARQMGWHGIRAETLCLAAGSRSTAELLSSAAQECRADLLVMGGYGHSRARERLLGGCTQSFLEASETAVFLVH